MKKPVLEHVEQAAATIKNMRIIFTYVQGQLVEECLTWGRADFWLNLFSGCPQKCPIRQRGVNAARQIAVASTDASLPAICTTHMAALK